MKINLSVKLVLNLKFTWCTTSDYINELELKILRSNTYQKLLKSKTKHFQNLSYLNCDVHCNCSVAYQFKYANHNNQFSEWIGSSRRCISIQSTIIIFLAWALSFIVIDNFLIWLQSCLYQWNKDKYCQKLKSQFTLNNAKLNGI